MALLDNLSKLPQNLKDQLHEVKYVDPYSTDWGSPFFSSLHSCFEQPIGLFFRETDKDKKVEDKKVDKKALNKTKNKRCIMQSNLSTILPEAEPQTEFVVLSSRFFKPQLLEPGNIYSIGRAPQNSICLPKKSISRFHAEIHMMTRTQSFLQDCNSRNGISLNGVKLNETKVPLRFGDYFTIGGINILFQKYVEFPQRVDFSETENAFVDSLDHQHKDPERMVGNLSCITILEILSTLNFFRKTGVLSLAHKDIRGKVQIEDGEIRNATFGKDRGVEAVHAIIQLEEGIFSFKTAPIDGEKEINILVEDILLNYARMVDESVTKGDTHTP